MPGRRSVGALRFFCFFLQRRFVTPTHYARTGQQGNRGKRQGSDKGPLLRERGRAAPAETEMALAPVGCVLDREMPLRRRSVAAALCPRHTITLTNHRSIPNDHFFFLPGRPSISGPCASSVPAQRPVCGGALRPVSLSGEAQPNRCGKTHTATTTCQCPVSCGRRVAV